jgi:hypothetical protein
MGDVSSRAQLIDASRFDARSQIAATLSREDIEGALRVKNIPELVLEIDRRSNGDVEAHTLRVAWAEDQLKELLRDTSGEDITLYFDGAELQQALGDEDIEAHGVRETTAAVLTVAAMAAGIGAAAHPASAAVGGGGGVEMVSDAASSGVATAPELISDAASSGVAATPELISDSASSGPSGVQVAEASGPELISDSASSGPSGVQVAEASGPELISDSASSGLSGVQVAEASGPELISDSASSGPSGVQVAEASGPELISDSASSGLSGVQVAEASGPELISDSASTGTVSPAQSTPVASAVSVSGTDSGMSSTEIAGTAVGAGLVLMITAAGFAMRGKNRREQLA